MANPGSSPALVAVEITRLDGSSLGLTGTVDVPASGQAALFLSQIPGLESLERPFRGIARVSGSNEISVVGLRARYNERSEFLITTTPPVDESTPPESGDRYFPHIVDGDGYTTDFILLTGTPGSSSGDLRLFSQDGVPVDWVLH